MMNYFESSSGRKWREGNSKMSFNYLLLDPRTTKNLPARCSLLGILYYTLYSIIYYILSILLYTIYSLFYYILYTLYSNILSILYTIYYLFYYILYTLYSIIYYILSILSYIICFLFYNLDSDSKGEAFKVFISAIFYIGKGKKTRPYQHFIEAIKVIYCILYTVYYILYIIYCILYTVYYILYIIYCNIIHCISYTV